MNFRYIAVLLLSVVWVRPGFSADKPKAGGLQEYLTHLGYGVVDCRRDKPNKLVLDAELASKKRRFLIDTGWGLTALAPATAHGLKTPEELGIPVRRPLPNWVTNLVIMENLTLGQSQFFNQPAAVQNLEMDYITTAEDGILGLDFLRRNFCFIDCGEERLYFRSAKRSAEQAEALEESLRLSGFLEAPMCSGLPFLIDAKIKGEDVRLLVDTGATFSMLSDSQVSRLGLRMEQQRQASTGTLIPQDLSGRIVGVGQIGMHKFRVTTLNTMQIGARQWTNVHVGVVNLQSFGIGKPGGWETVQGMLGADILLNGGALIDCSSEKIWFRPEKR